MTSKESLTNKIIPRLPTKLVDRLGLMDERELEIKRLFDDTQHYLSILLFDEDRI